MESDNFFHETQLVVTIEDDNFDDNPFKIDKVKCNDNFSSDKSSAFKIQSEIIASDFAKEA